MLATVGWTFTVADSPYDDNVDVERHPYAPDRPSAWNEPAAVAYGQAYEERHLHNDLLATRGRSLDTHNRVIANCSAASVSETEPDGYRVELQCTGGIDDTMRVLDPGPFTYRVTYHVTETGIRQLDVRSYPHGDRGTFREQTPEA